jgi:hypothetical protein
MLIGLQNDLIFAKFSYNYLDLFAKLFDVYPVPGFSRGFSDVFQADKFGA